MGRSGHTPSTKLTKSITRYSPRTTRAHTQSSSKPTKPSTKFTKSATTTNATARSPHAHHLNWSYFKPEFSGKMEEDAVAHLLKTNDWMETHNFLEDTKVRRFCLTLTGEARCWYESIRPIEMDWTALQEHFRQQYSKFGSSREQYFHVWRSFQYDENTDTIDSYILKITQVASLLNYGELEILELFKNTLPSKIVLDFISNK